MAGNILFGNAKHIGHCFVFQTCLVFLNKNYVPKSANEHLRQNLLHLYAIVYTVKPA